MDDQNRNLILATALSFLVILVWFLLFPPPPPETVTAPQQAEIVQPDGALAPGQLTAGAGLLPRAEALARSARVPIQTERLRGSISLVGGRVDDLDLIDYFETVEEGSPTVTLLNPAGTADAYYALYGWAPAGGLPADAVPGPTTEWSVESGEILTEATPVTLVWDNGAGLVFRRVMSVDENFMFTVSQSVENATAAEVRLQPYGIIARHGRPQDLRGFWILHEGVIGAADGILQQLTWNALDDLPPDPAEGAAAETIPVTENGWIGFTDHYWMSTMVDIQ
jgi:YidC/Oxa1 family membrane protein insertase